MLRQHFFTLFLKTTSRPERALRKKKYFVFGMDITSRSKQTITLNLVFHREYFTMMRADVFVFVFHL